MKFFDRVKMAFNNGHLFDFLQRYVDDYMAGNDVPTANHVGPITGDGAMCLSAVFACNRVLAETLAVCPIFMYEKQADGSRKQVTDSPLYELLHFAPNPDMTPGQFKEACVSNINLGGNFVAQKVKNGKGEVIQLRPINWNRVRIEPDKEKNEMKYYVDKQAEPLTRDKILHIPGITLDGYIGITPIEYISSTITSGRYQDSFTQNFYNNGVMTSGVFESDGVLKEEAFQRLKKDLQKNYAGLKNAGVPMILEDGLKYREVTMKLSDAQFIESKKFTKEEIASVYRVPLHLVQDLSRSTNNNIEHQSLEFIMYTMLPWYKRCEENLNLQIMPAEDRRKGRYFEFKIDVLLRGDAETRAKAYAQGRQWGWLSVNDIRKLENMNSIGLVGDIYLTPANMYEAGKQPTNAQIDSKLNQLTEELYKMISGGEKV